MKRFRAAHVIGIVLLLFVSLTPTRSFGLSENLELARTYYQGSTAVGGEVFESCFGGFNSSWGVQEGSLMREKYTHCDTGETYCRWYTWTESGWALALSGDCGADGDRDRPDRPRI